MVSLVNKKLSDDGGLPQILKEARFKSGISLEKIEKLSLVPSKYLSALEEGRYWDLPSYVYGRQFLKAYSKYVYLDSAQVLEKFDKEYQIYNCWHNRSEKVKGEVATTSPKMIIGPGVFKKAIGLVLFLAFFGYIGFEISQIIESPNLVVDSPEDNLVTSRQIIEIRGWVEPESKLQINGQEVYSDRKGNFSELIGLQAGVNLINFRAQKKYSRERLLTRKVLVESDSGSASIELKISRNNN